MKNFKDQAQDMMGKKIKGYMADGGHADEAQDKALIKGMVKPLAMKKGYADGGMIDGGMAKMNLGKSGHKRGGKGKKGGTHVNVIVAGGGPKPPMAGPGPMAAPDAGPLPGGPGAGAMPPAPPPGAGSVPGGPMPPMRKGGAVKRASGGRVGGIKDGAGGGKGRLEKIKAYGDKA
jgi:hypothetical protein